MMAENDIAWYRQAACNGMDSDIFFPSERSDYQAAKTICATCPVKQPCLNYGLQHFSSSAGADLGVWGGLSPAERRRLRRRRGA